jgi:hypothetical protein
VSIAAPGVLSAADYAQLAGLSFADKVRQMRAFLNEVKATRTPQQVAQLGPFRWQEAIGQSGEVLFIGQGAPRTTNRPTVIVIKGHNGEVYRMLPAGLKGVISQGPPRVIDFDLNAGQAQLMVV